MSRRWLSIAFDLALDRERVADSGLASRPSVLEPSVLEVSERFQLSSDSRIERLVGTRLCPLGRPGLPIR